MCLTSTYIFHQGLSSKETPEHITLNKSCNPQIKKIEVQTMNGRIYDPTIGQFLSPDNHVQLPDASLGFNRYAYCLNNPLVYTDPSGESFLGILAWTAVATLVTSHVGGVIEAIRHGGINWHLSSQARQDAWTKADPFLSGTRANNYWAINRGLFVTNEHAEGKTRGLSRSWELVSRFTPWQLPLTYAGYTLNQTFNTFGEMETIGYYHGATVTIMNENFHDYGAVTFGNYINIAWPGVQRYQNVNDANDLLQHEYGHYRQARDLGPLVIPMSIQSGMSAIGWASTRHGNTWWEADANARARDYFTRKGVFDQTAGTSPEQRQYQNFIRRHPTMQYGGIRWFWYGVGMVYKPSLALYMAINIHNSDRN